MLDADYFREKAKTCRRLAAGAAGKRRPGRRGSYLLELAERFDREAAIAEARYGGDKPATERRDPAPRFLRRRNVAG